MEGTDLSVLHSHNMGPRLLTWISLNFPEWINNHIYYEVWDEISHLFPNFNGAIVEVWGMDKLFQPTVYQAGDYLFMLGLKLNHVSKRVPWDTDGNIDNRIDQVCPEYSGPGHCRLRTRIIINTKNNIGGGISVHHDSHGDRSKVYFITEYKPQITNKLAGKLTIS